jgi:putative lipoic acid-binding regulatory protein
MMTLKSRTLFILSLVVINPTSGFVPPVQVKFRRQALSDALQNDDVSDVSSPLQDSNDKGDSYQSSSRDPKVIESSAELPERFNYKVQALMGSFDPIGVDDERQEGNILNALLNFPARYTFNVVGKTLGLEDLQNEYVDKVKKLLLESTGDDSLVCESLRRGKNFTKVKCEVNVLSVAMINNVYDELEKLELTVMKF